MLLLAACAATDTTGPCTGGDGWMECEHETLTLEDRDVHWQAPTTDGPHPLALLFQGSLFPATLFWSGNDALPFGGWEQVRLVSQLLDAGYVVVSPEAWGEGWTCWNTNLPWYADDWEEAPDAALVDAIFAEADAGTFGDVDGWYAAGISSGGYMTSRVGVEFPDRFAALAIESASYATCVGAICDVPTLADDHPPTLFLHGELDLVVPIGTMRDYEAVIPAEVDEVVDPWGGHGWVPGAAEVVVDWFAEH